MRWTPGKCLQGHELTPENTYVRASGTNRPNECRICRKESHAVNYRKRRAKPPEAPVDGPVIRWPDYEDAPL